MEVRLILKTGPARGRVFHLRDEESVIGRARGCALRVPSADVSRTHCRLVARDGTVTVEDLGSLNGTRLNGDPVTGVADVRPGDLLQVGPVRFTVEYEPQAAASDAFEIVEEPADDALEVVADDAPLPIEDDVMPTLSKPGSPPGVDIDRDPDWHPPPGEGLRDLLEQIDSSDELPRAARGKKKKKK